MVSPVNMRKFTTAVDFAGSTFSAWLPSNMVGAVVVLIVAFVPGDEASSDSITGPKSHILAKSIL